MGVEKPASATSPSADIAVAWVRRGGGVERSAGARLPFDDLVVDGRTWVEHVRDLRTPGTTVIPDRGLLHWQPDDADPDLWLHVVTPDLGAQHEDQFDRFQSLSGIASWGYDLRTGVTTWSREMYRMLGADPETDEPDFDLFVSLLHPDDVPLLTELLEAANQGLRETLWSARIRRRDTGEIRWLEERIACEHDSSGPARMLGTCRDVTELRIAEERAARATRQLSLLHVIATAANEAKDLESALADAMGALHEISRWQACGAYRDPQGNAFIEIPDGCAPDPDDLAECWTTGRILLASDPAPFVSRVYLPLKAFGEVVCVLDVAAHEGLPDESTIRTTTQIVRHLEQVAERVQTAEALSHALDEARRASDAKSDFLATMSHELRTPLNGVVGLTELLLGTDLDDRQRQLAQALHNSGGTLLTLINDALDLSKVEAGRLVLEEVPFTLTALVEDVTAGLAVQARAKGLDLAIEREAELPDHLVGDPVRLGQVLTNLVANAVKFTETGRVCVRLSRTRHDDDRLHIDVEDTGPGVDPALHDRIFEPFRQAAASTTREFGGTGLGLAISRRIVEAMGGRLTLRSERGQGSTFSFSVPLRRALHTAPAQQPALAGARLGLHVLVAEDNPTNRLVLGGLLDTLGCTYEVAHDGEAAVEAVRERGPYSVVLMDCRMPRVDGYEATRTIRAWEQAEGRPRTPIVAVTASALEGDGPARDAGMDGFVAKPIDPRQLQRVLTGLPALAHPDADDDRPVLDEERVALLSGIVRDGQNAFSRIRDSLLGRLPRVAAGLEQALARSDVDSVVALAHELKGAAGNVGLARLADVADLIELDGEAGDLEAAAGRLSLLRTAVGEGVAALTEAQPSTTSTRWNSLRSV